MKLLAHELAQTLLIESFEMPVNAVRTRERNPWE
jgi:hypothetical protein